MHALERSRSESTLKGRKRTTAEGSNTPASINNHRLDTPSDTLQDSVGEHALSLARVFLEMSVELAGELPKFHYICIAYCTHILSECSATVRNVSQQEIRETINNVCSVYGQVTDAVPAIMNLALEKVELGRERDTSSRQARKPPRTPVPARSLAIGQPYMARGNPGQKINVPPAEEAALTGLQAPYWTSAFPADSSSKTGEYFTMDEPESDMRFLTLPTVEDFFGNWMTDVGNEYPEYPYPD